MYHRIGMEDEKEEISLRYSLSGLQSDRGASLSHLEACLNTIPKSFHLWVQRLVFQLPGMVTEV